MAASKVRPPMKKLFIVLPAVILLTLMTLVLVLSVNMFVDRCPQPAAQPAPAIAVDGRAAARRLGQAIRLQTISSAPAQPADRMTAFLQLHDFLRTSFPRVHEALTREIVDRYSLLYTWAGVSNEQKPILLAAHLDVVPVESGTEGRWSHPAFSGHIADGYVWGRGSMDLKVSVLGMLEGIELLLAQGFRPSRTVYLAFGHDEELGGENGAAKIAARLASRGVKLEYVLDEGMSIMRGAIPGVNESVAFIGIAEKGLMTVELAATGTGGHASMPPPKTAVGLISTAIHEIDAHPMPAEITPPVEQLFVCASPHMALMQRMIFANVWLFKPVIKRELEKKPNTNGIIRTTAAATIVSGGTKDNVLPTEARAVVNVRLLPGDSADAAVGHLRRVVRDVRVRITPLTRTEASPVSDTKSMSFAILATTIRQVFPDALVVPNLFVARTDSQHYLPLAGATYRFLPLRLNASDLSRIHGTDERVAVDNYADIIRFYAQLIRNS